MGPETSYSYHNDGRKDVMQPRSWVDARTVPYKSTSKGDSDSGVYVTRQSVGFFFGVLILLAGMVAGGGVYLASRQALFNRLQEDLSILEDEVEKLRAKDRQLETEDVRLRTRIENLEE